MLQPQITEYAKSQLKLGVSREEIKVALLSAGWTETDIDDSINSLDAESAAMAPGAAQGGQEGKIEAVAAFDPTKKFLGNDLLEKPSFSAPAGTIKKEGPVVVSDLTAARPKEVKKGEEKKSAEAKAAPEEKPSKFGELGAAKAPRFSRQLIAIIALAVLALASSAGAAYLYLQTMDLNEQVTMFEGAAETSEQQISRLNSRISELQNEISDLRKENAGLALELSFFAAPLGALDNASFSDLNGVLSGGGRSSYFLKTVRGTVLTVRNSQDEAVAAALEPLLGSEVFLSGTYEPGTRNITVTAVNGNPIEAVTGE